MRRFPVGLLAMVLLSAACGGAGESGDGSPDGSDAPSVDSSADSADSSADSVEDSSPVEIDAELPAPCALPPYTAVVERVGPSPAGSATFTVVDAVVVPLPLVPDPEQELEPGDAIAAAAETDLLGYSILVADEDIDEASVGLFSGYEPEEPGKLRAFVSVFPSTLTPIAVGDVITYSTDLDLEMFTTLSSLGLDLKASAGEFNAYLDSPVGQVEVLALTDGAACFDVDLRWTLSGNGPGDGSGDGSGDGGTVTIRGILAGGLVARPNLPLG